MKIKISNIEWDKFDATEFDAVDIARLPLEVEQDFAFNDYDEEELADYLGNWLSDTFGFCHFGFNYEIMQK